MPETTSPATNPTSVPVATAPTDAPPWGDDFDAEKAWNLVQNLRSDKERLQSRPVLTDEAKQKLAEYDRLAEASKSELDKAQEAAQTNAQRAQALLNRAVNAEIRALASGFADPEDAAAFLSGKQYADDNGDIDTAAIKADLADLLTRKPHLAALDAGGGRRAPRPDPTQASGANGAAPTSPATEFASILQGQLNKTQ
ncbi:MAG: hypothetical protein ACXVXP_02950 [Mycobacteriaceae bacterium]